jgi:hypothetical protein
MCPVIHSYPQAGAQGCVLAALRHEPYTGQSGLYTGDWGRSGPVLGTVTKRWWTYPQALWTTLGTAFPSPQLVHKPSLALCVRRGCGRSGARADVSLCTRSAVCIAPSVEKPYKLHNAKGSIDRGLGVAPRWWRLSNESTTTEVLVVVGLRPSEARRGALRGGAGNPVVRLLAGPSWTTWDGPAGGGPSNRWVPTGSARHVRRAGAAVQVAPWERNRDGAPDLRGRCSGFTWGPGSLRGRGLVPQHDRGRRPHQGGPGDVGEQRQPRCCCLILLVSSVTWL